MIWRTKTATWLLPGEVALGGGWIDTEFDDLTVTPLAEDALKGVRVEEYRMALTTQEKRRRNAAKNGRNTPPSNWIN